MIPARVRALFPPAVRARGEAYAADGRVEIEDAVESGVVATVHGSAPYHVEIAAGGGTFGAGCTCPYADEHSGTCKHVWAALLEADAEELIPWDAPEYDAPRAPAPGAPPDAAPRRPGRQWKNELQAVAQTMALHGRAPEGAARAAWPEDRRLAYVVDLETTRARGQLAVEVATERYRKDGLGWDRPVAFRLGRDVWAAAPDPRDRTLLHMLLGARPEALTPAYYGVPLPESTPSRFLLGRTAIETTLPLLCETGRCRLRRAHGEERPPALEWDDGPPWRAALRLTLVDAHGAVLPADAGPRAHAVRLDAVLRRGDGGDEMPLDRPALFLADGVLILDAGDRAERDPPAPALAARFAHDGAFPLLSRLRAGPVTAAAADLPLFLETLCALPALPPLELPGGDGALAQGTAPVAGVVVRSPAKGEYTNGRLVVEATFDYGGVRVDGARPGPAVYDATAGRVLLRDQGAERAAAARLHALGVREEREWGAGGTRLLLPPGKLDALVAALAGEGWRVEAQGVVYRAAGTLAARVRSGVDWFDLEGAADFGGVAVPFPRLLDAVRRGARTVVLDDGTHGLLPAEWLARLAPLAALGTGMADARGDAAGDAPGAETAARFTRAQASLLDALVAELPAVDVDAAFARARDELRTFAGVAPADPPPGFAGTLRGYQREGLGWIGWLRALGVGGCLADDMGLGKTVQVLAHLEGRREAGAGPSLAVVPRSLLYNWQAEAARFAPAMRVLDYTGSKRPRAELRAALEARTVDLVLTTYGTLRRDAPELAAVEFDTVVLDEAQAIKNAGTAASKAARLLRARHRLAVTGTPVENRLDELWALFDFLSPGLLGAARGRAAAALGAAGAATAEGAAARSLLARALRPYILRRTKAEVAPELPPRQEQTLWVTLGDAQRALYDELRDHYRAELLARVARDGMARSRIHVLEALLRLRQAACHPGLVDPARADVPAAKLDVLHERLGEVVAEGHKVLVFSQFTKLLALVRTRLEAAGVPYAYLDGRTRDRAGAVTRFQEDPACPVFLVSLKAGGVGLNLTAAEYVFLLDPWWNPAVEAQAVDRAHRIGQTRAVFAARLVARDTVEERVLALQETKRSLADAVLGADARGLAGIGREELALLLG